LFNTSSGLSVQTAATVIRVHVPGAFAMNLSALRLFGVFSLAILSVSNTSPAPANPILVLTHVTVIDGDGGPPQPDITVLISGERISDIYPGAKKRLPAGAQIMNLRGHFVMPGLIDSHYHFMIGTRHCSSDELRGRRQAGFRRSRQETWRYCASVEFRWVRDSLNTAKPAGRPYQECRSGLQWRARLGH
jgi:hypothetical protein